MKIPPNIHDTASIKKTTKRNRAFPRRVTRVRTTTIKGPIKNSIEITSKDSRDRRINLGMKIIQKEITIGIVVGTIGGTNTKSLVLEGKLALKEATSRIRPRIEKR